MSGTRVAFTGGEWYGMGAIRNDVDGYDRSAREIVNFFVHSFGGLMRRPGTERMCVVDGGAARGMVRLMGMDVSDERRYVVAFGAGFVEVSSLDGSVAARLESPWAEGDLQELRWVQCNDVVWVVCGRVAPQRLERHGDDDWRLVEMVFDRTPRENLISKDGEVWVERDWSGFTLGSEKDVFGEEDVGSSVLYTQHVPERLVKVLPTSTVLGGTLPPKVCPDLSAAGTQVQAGQEVWVVEGEWRRLWTCYKFYYRPSHYNGSKSPADYPDHFFPGWVASRFTGSGYNSVQESRSREGVQRAFLCHEGPWALTTYGNENQQWAGDWELVAADAEEESLDPRKYEVVHSFSSYGGAYRNYSFSGDFTRAKRVQLRVLKYAPAMTWGGHELRLNAYDYEAEGTVERVGAYDGAAWGAVLDLEDGRVLLAAREQRRCYVFDSSSGKMTGVGAERAGGCGWVGGCVLGDGRAFLISGGQRCCVLDVVSGTEEAVELPDVVGSEYFGEAVLLGDGRVLLTPYKTTAFYAYDVAAAELEKLAHTGVTVTRGMFRHAVPLGNGRVLLCAYQKTKCAVLDVDTMSMSQCATTAPLLSVFRTMRLSGGEVLLFLADGEDGEGKEGGYALGLFDPAAGKIEEVGVLLSAVGGFERADGSVVFFTASSGDEAELEYVLDVGQREIRSVARRSCMFPHSWVWGRYVGDGAVLLNGMTGEPVMWHEEDGFARMGVDAMRFRVARLSYKTYGGAGLPYDRAVTDVWSKGMFGGGRGWPGAVAMHQGRLWLAGTAANPQTVWGSVVDDFGNFKMGDGDDDAIQVTLAAKDRHRIVWMESVNDLLIGSTAQVWRLSGGEGGVVTPDFCRASVQLRVGCCKVDAEATDGGCVFVQRGGVRVKELGYSFEADGYRAADTTTYAEHVGGPGGFVGLAVQQVPEVRIWGVRADGGLAVLTYNAEQRVCAWSRHVLGGGGKVLSVAVMDGVDADEVWLAVERGGVVGLERIVEGCRVFRDGWSRDGEAGVPYESVLVSNELAFAEMQGVKWGSVSVRARFSASAADGVRVGFCGRLTELSRSRGAVVDGWQDLAVPGVWSDELVFELRCAGDGDMRFLGMNVQFSK